LPLISLNQVNTGFLFAVYWIVVFEKVHDCIIVRNQIIKVLICKNVFLLNLAPKLAGCSFDFRKEGGGINSESTYIAVFNVINYVGIGVFLYLGD